MLKTIQAIRIMCNGAAISSPPAGVYATARGLDIRISEDVVTGSDLVYAAGYISLGGIGQLQESADLRRGGDMASLQGITIQLNNAERLFLTLKTAGVTVQGCPVEIHEFEWDATANPTPSQGTTLSDVTVFTGIVDDVQWDALGLVLKLKNSRLRRNAQIGTIIDNGNYTDYSQIIDDIQNSNQRGNFPFADDSENGKIVPCTFGAFPFSGVVAADDESSLAPAKLVRTASAVIPLPINGTIPHNGYLSSPDYFLTHFSNPGDPHQYELRLSSVWYGDVSAFPIISSDGSLSGWQASSPVFRYLIRIGNLPSGIVWYMDGSILPQTGAAYCVTLAGTINGSSIKTDGSDPEGTPFGKLYGRFINCIGGDGSGARMIVGAQLVLGSSGTFPAQQGMPLYGSNVQQNLAPDPLKLLLTIAVPFEKTLSTYPSAGDTVDHMEWIEIDEIKSEYDADLWPCAGLLDENGNEI